ncbi:MAG TPA: Flp family type IVb pilin [Sphingomonadaceae bacterium]
MKTNKLLKAILEDRSGATAIEYGLIAALIVIAMITALNNFANSTISMWNTVSTKMSDADKSVS